MKREEMEKLNFWQRIHYGLGANELPVWQWVLIYCALVALPLLLLWTIWFT